MSACPDLQTDVSIEEATAILEPYFEAVRDRFMEAGFEEVSRTKLAVKPWAHDRPRHFAACRDDGLEIIESPVTVELPQDILVGITAHEFGHAVDFLHRGEFWLGRNDALVRRSREEAGSDTQWVRWLKAWRERDEDVVERVADAIASAVMGAPVGYVGPCWLQSFRDGVRPRPLGLR